LGVAGHLFCLFKAALGIELFQVSAMIPGAKFLPSIIVNHLMSDIEKTPLNGKDN